MKKFLVLLIFAAFVGTAFAAIAVADNGPAVIKLDKASTGVVTFDHAKHQGLTECKVCHHTETYEACDSCHGAADDGAKLKYKTAIHKNCQDCHKEMKKGPTKCKECHIK